MIFFLTLKEKARTGFSMIELLIAMTITCIFILGTAQLTLHSIQLKRKSDCLVRAAELASMMLENFKSLPYDSIELEDVDLSETIDDDRSNHAFLQSFAIQEVSPSLKRVEMECYAKNYPRKRMRVVIYLSRELGF